MTISDDIKMFLSCFDTILFRQCYRTAEGHAHNERLYESLESNVCVLSKFLSSGKSIIKI